MFSHCTCAGNALCSDCVLCFACFASGCAAVGEDDGEDAGDEGAAEDAEDEEEAEEDESDDPEMAKFTADLDAAEEVGAQDGQHARMCRARPSTCVVLGSLTLSLLG